MRWQEALNLGVYIMNYITGTSVLSWLITNDIMGVLETIHLDKLTRCT